MILQRSSVFFWIETYNPLHFYNIVNVLSQTNMYIFVKITHQCNHYEKYIPQLGAKIRVQTATTGH